MKDIIELKNVDKFFMHSQALAGVCLKIGEGEIVGIVGHNGAGKSTLVNIVTGTYPQTAGELLIDGEIPVNYDIHEANKKGIRTVFQELSLCGNLSAVENIRIFHRALSGPGWRKKAASLVMEVMDTIFPGHGISPMKNVGDLTLGQRQILEIAKAFIVTDTPSRLIILDEPTSALDPRMARQLTDYLRSSQNRKISCIYISHILDEVLSCTDRIVVMKNGGIVSILSSESADKQRILEQMGKSGVSGTPSLSLEGGGKKKNLPSSIHEPSREPSGAASGSDPEAFVIRPSKAAESGEDIRETITVRRGEIVGLAGLAGHGQTALLLSLYDYKRNGDYFIAGPAAFVAGDRQNDGIFPIWSIVKNMTVQSWEKVKRFLLIDPRKEHAMAEKWQRTIDVRAASLDDNILSLSGGNQQKVLFARCLESASSLVLMDDPTRGVDVETKDEIYRIILEEKAGGRSFVWYTTEMSEVRYCDAVYVFKNGKIVARLTGDKITEEEIVKSSF
ncbi:MAG: sugar ABC transporter ATP-binding protein [Synergistaceae bacterium]|jgi:ribose transport system ATP-binding protein|nr:sugar ABC transporter ATP-binding protein [Synergistaceae bacterium]